MKYSPQPFLLCIGLIALAGCPGGDDDDDTDRDQGGGGSAASNAATAGKGAAGKGGSTAGKGSSDGGKGGVTADQAAAGVCEMMGAMPVAGAGAPRCTGIDEYTQCTQEKCGSDDCYDGRCKDLLDCYENAADPCKADCQPSSECMACLTEVGTCAADECFQLVMCGETEEGGACDELDDCCETQADNAKMACMSAAASSRSGGGDELCMTILMSLCPD